MGRDLQQKREKSTRMAGRMCLQFCSSSPPSPRTTIARGLMELAPSSTQHNNAKKRAPSLRSPQLLSPFRSSPRFAITWFFIHFLALPISLSLPPPPPLAHHNARNIFFFERDLAVCFVVVPPPMLARATPTRDHKDDRVDSFPFLCIPYSSFLAVAPPVFTFGLSTCLQPVLLLRQYMKCRRRFPFSTNL